MLGDAARAASPPPIAVATVRPNGTAALNASVAIATATTPAQVVRVVCRLWLHARCRADLAHATDPSASSAVIAKINLTFSMRSLMLARGGVQGIVYPAVNVNLMATPDTPAA